MKGISTVINKIAEVGIALGAISFVFYFIGFVNEAFYYSVLSVKWTLLDYSYQEYVFFGVIQSLMFFWLVPTLLDWISDYNRI
jgi:hypothetical protein